MIYFTENNGNTVIFDEVFNGTNNAILEENNINTLPILEEISPFVGKGVIFDGKYLHAMRPPTNPTDRRVVCVICFSDINE